MAEEAKDRAGMIAVVAAIVATRCTESGIFSNEGRHHVEEARRIIEASYESEGLPTPFPSGAVLTPLTIRSSSEGTK